MPYSNLVHRDILTNLLKKEEQDREQKFNLNDHFESYINDLEQRNIENVDHFKQICSHEKDLIANSKNHKNLEEFAEYKESVFKQIDSSLPPYFIPRTEHTSKQSESSDGRIIEPYSELEDYLDKDDLTNLLGVLGQFAGKTSSGLLSFGESILNQFVFKNKNELDDGVDFDPESNLDNDENYVVPG